MSLATATSHESRTTAQCRNEASSLVAPSSGQPLTAWPQRLDSVSLSGVADDLYEHDDDYYDDSPGVDEPENRLHFDELHPLIQRAARQAWDEGDYHRAVVDAWTVIRDRLRERLGTNLDGLKLVQAIHGARRRPEGESQRDTIPRLPLTEFDSETTRNMHYGLVHLLEGIVLYVRNPEQHETTSPVEGDKEAAFERLALMSICARHVDVRTEPITVDEAMEELRQERFVDTKEARVELVEAVPARDHATLSDKLIETRRQADEAGDERLALRCRSLHRQLSLTAEERHRNHVLTAICRQVSALVRRDATLELAIRFVTPPVFERLAQRDQSKIAARLLDEAKIGRRTRKPLAGELQSETVWIFRALRQDDRSALLRLLDLAIQSDEPDRRTYGTWVALLISRHLRPHENDRLAQRLVDALGRGASEIASELTRTLHRSPGSLQLRSLLAEKLAQATPQTPEAESLLAETSELIERLMPKVRKTVTRPRT